MRRLEDINPEELKTIPYHTPRASDPRKETILALRADAFQRHVEAMTTAGQVPDDLIRWADRMARAFGPRVKVWRNTCDWIVALMIVRYGEDVGQWPDAFTAADVKRADVWWKRGDKTPRGVTYLGVDSQAGSAAVGLLTGVGWFGGWTPRLPKWLTGVRALLAALTDFWENEWIDNFFRARSYTPPTSFYFGLFTAAPGETGGGTEVSGGSYARAQLDPSATNWQGTGGESTATDSTGTGGATQNLAAITFPTPSANWGTVTDMACFDASSGGNMLWYATLTDSKDINNGDPAPSFPIGSLTFTLG